MKAKNTLAVKSRLWVYSTHISMFAEGLPSRHQGRKQMFKLDHSYLEAHLVNYNIVWHLLKGAIKDPQWIDDLLAGRVTPPKWQCRGASIDWRSDRTSDKLSLLAICQIIVAHWSEADWALIDSWVQLMRALPTIWSASCCAAERSRLGSRKATFVLELSMSTSKNSGFSGSLCTHQRTVNSETENFGREAT